MRSANEFLLPWFVRATVAAANGCSVEGLHPLRAKVVILILITVFWSPSKEPRCRAAEKIGGIGNRRFAINWSQWNCRIRAKPL